MMNWFKGFVSDTNRPMWFADGYNISKHVEGYGYSAWYRGKPIVRNVKTLADAKKAAEQHNKQKGRGND